MCIRDRAGIGWWAFGGNNSSEFNQLAEANFIHYPIEEIRGDEDPDAIYENYINKNYQLAAPELKESGDKNSDPEKWLFSAISYLALDNPEECINLVEKIGDNPSLNNKKFYYKGLAYLKKGNKNKAIQSFKEINEIDEFIFNKAQHICLLYTSPSPRDRQKSRMPSSA